MIKVSEYNKFLSYNKNKLFLEEIPLENLAEKFDTPLFCYSVSQIENNFTELQKAFKKVRPLICYALKANFNSNIIKILSNLGCGIDVVSNGELQKSLKNGVDNQKIVFSGVGKTNKEIEIAIKKNIKQINVESIEELNEIAIICKRLNKTINICLRVNPNVDAKTHEKISTGRSEDKFGILDKNVYEIFKKYKRNKFIKIMGLSIHIGSQIVLLEPFYEAFKKIKLQILKLKKEGFDISSLDLGGGVGIKYNDKNKILDIKSYAQVIDELFSDLDIEIIIEPGRYLVGSSGIILSRVIRTKSGKNKDFAIIDAGMDNLIRPALYGAEHKIIPVKKKGEKNLKIYDIVGPICETSDVFIKKMKIHRLNSDDLVVICSTGAYSSCMASNYNLREPAKEVFIKKKKLILSKSR